MNYLNNLLADFFEYIHGLIQMGVSDTGVAYGLSIIAFTLIIRIIILPLYIKQTRSQLAMQEIQPEVNKLQAKYKNDPQKSQQEMMKLYKEKGVNPFSGCLPLLIQMPILFALYHVFNTLEGIKGVGFLWLPDLAAKDPYYILPVLSVIFTYWSTTMVASKDKDNPQAKQMATMNIFMSGMMGFMAMNLKSSLVLYWVAGSVIQVAQTYVFKKIGESKKNKSNENTVKEKVK